MRVEICHRVTGEALAQILDDRNENHVKSADYHGSTTTSGVTGSQGSQLRSLSSHVCST